MSALLAQVFSFFSSFTLISTTSAVTSISAPCSASSKIYSPIFVLKMISVGLGSNCSPNDSCSEPGPTLTIVSSEETPVYLSNDVIDKNVPITL